LQFTHKIGFASDQFHALLNLWEREKGRRQ